MRYIISDTHFGHEEIIEYCSRPFASVEEMNDALVERWNETVAPQDTVIHLGDVRHSSDGRPTEWWLDQLNGDILLVRGNHDDAPDNCGVHTVDLCQLTHGKYHFHLEHRPAGVSGWHIHGHTHNNDLNNYPCIHPGRQTVNASAELLGYRPLSLDRLTRLLDKNKRYNYLPDHERQTP